MKIILLILVVVISIIVGSLVFCFTNVSYTELQFQGPYNYNVIFEEGTQDKNLGIVINLNISHFTEKWLVGSEKVISLDISADRNDNDVQNFSWRAFWVELFSSKDGTPNIVGQGDFFLNEIESSQTRLYKHMGVPVRIVNVNYLESVSSAWFRVDIMMDINYNGTEYSLTTYTPTKIGSISILSPLWSPVSLAAVSAVATTLTTALVINLNAKRRKASPSQHSLTRQ